MFKVDYQVHGSTYLESKFFASLYSVDAWMLAHQDFLSFSRVYEVFH